MGGQVGDIGSVIKKGSDIKVIDCKKVGNFHLHEVEISSGELSKNDKAEESYHGRYQYYYIRKKDFNIEKWWLGWTGEGD